MHLKVLANFPVSVLSASRSSEIEAVLDRICQMEVSAIENSKGASFTHKGQGLSGYDQSLGIHRGAGELFSFHANNSTINMYSM